MKPYENHQKEHSSKGNGTHKKGTLIFKKEMQLIKRNTHQKEMEPS